MSSIFRKRAGRASALVTAVGMVAFLVQLAIIPASAAAPPPDDVGSIFPVSGGPFFNDYTGTASTAMNLVSDKVGPADLTAISTHTVGATQMTWYDCAPTTGPGSDVQGPFFGIGPLNLDASCVQDGQDTTPTLAAISTVTALTRADIDDAWSIAFDIPARLAGIQRDLVAVACNGTALSNGENCTADTVDTWFDDSGTSGVNATSSGTITSISPSFSDTPGAVNGVAVSALDETLDTSGTTSSELTEVAFNIDDCGVTAASPQGCSDVSENDWSIVDTPDTTTATAKTWSTEFPDNSGPMDFDSTAALTFSGTDNGSFRTLLVPFANCNGVLLDACAMDRVYMVQEDGSGFADHTFLRLAADVTADPTCKTGTTTISAPAGSTVDLTGCVINSFKLGVADDTVKWAVNDLANASFVGTPDLATDANGYAMATMTGPTSAVGKNVTVIFCADETNNGICDSVDTTSAFQITWTGVTAGTHTRNVSLKLKDSLRARGKVTVPDGFGACASKVPVKVQKRTSGHWKTLRTVKTSGTGAYHASLPNRHGRYRALAPKVTKAGATCLKARSSTRRA